VAEAARFNLWGTPHSGSFYRQETPLRAADAGLIGVGITAASNICPPEALARFRVQKPIFGLIAPNFREISPKNIGRRFLFLTKFALNHDAMRDLGCAGWRQAEDQIIS
jgi:hypothetical protein